MRVLQGFICNKRLRLSPDVPPYQRFREDPAEIQQKKMLEKYVRSCYVYENKQISDKKPARKSDIYVLDSDICVEPTRILQKFGVNSL